MIMRPTLHSDVLGNSVRCLAHSMQLCINEGLKKVSTISTIIDECRAVVGHFKHSYKASEGLNLYQKKFEVPEHKLIQCVPTRWNSINFRSP